MTLERRKEIESVIGKLEEILKRIERFGEDEEKQFESLAETEKETERNNDHGNSMLDYISDLAFVSGSLEGDIKLLNSIIDR